LKKIAILCKWGEFYGNGHLSRMMSLLWYLNLTGKVEAFLILNEVPPHFPKSLYPYLKTKVDFKPNLIIRDMRDSCANEIEELQQFCPVMVIDDEGEGRLIADDTLTLLPNLYRTCENSDMFIYGYDFIQSMGNLQGKRNSESIHCTVYEHKEYMQTIKKYLPKNTIVQILPLTVEDKPKTIGEVLFSSKILITHFGLLVFEGLLCGCKVITINSTEYLNALSLLLGNRIYNLGLYKNIIWNDFSEKIESLLFIPKDPCRSPMEILSIAIDNLERIYKHIKMLISL